MTTPLTEMPLIIHGAFYISHSHEDLITSTALLLVFGGRSVPPTGS